MKITTKRNKVIELCNMANEKVYTTELIAKRADKLQSYGVKALDSFHLAIAESADIDVLLTTDDRLLNLTTRLSLSLRVENPLKWLSEVL